MITEDMKQAAKNVFMAMAYVKTIRPIVTGYQKAVLEKHQWHIASKWVGRRSETDRVILDPDHSYLLSENDFRTYMHETREQQKAAGLKTDSPDHCPLLVAENLQRQAEWCLFDTMEPLTSIKGRDLYGDNREKYLDLTLRLLAPFI